MNVQQALYAIGIFLLLLWLFFALCLAWFMRLAPRGERMASLNAYAMGVIVWAVACLFLAYVPWLMGVGSVFPFLLDIATPLACPGGHLEALPQALPWGPGMSGKARHFACLLANGERLELLAPTLYWAGLLWGAVWLTLFLWAGKLGLRLIRLGPKREPGESAEEYERRTLDGLAARRNAAHARARARLHADSDDASDADPAARLRQLKALRDEGLIDADEFATRKARIPDTL